MPAVKQLARQHRRPPSKYTGSWLIQIRIIGLDVLKLNLKIIVP